MKLPNITGVVNVVKTFVIANRPEILLGAALTATVGTAVLAAQGGYKARGIIDDATADKGEPLDVKEKIQLTWLCYIPATIAASTALGSIAGLHLVHVKEKKALATAGMAALEEAKKSAETYRKELVEATDEETVKEIDAKAKKEGNPEWISDETLYLVQDEFTGRTFWSSETRIQAAVNEVNKKLNKEGNCDLNTFYMWAGVEELDRGIEVGWSGLNVALTWEDEHTRTTGAPVRKFIFRPQPSKGFDEEKTHPA